jgi:hypothetical protein
VRASDLVHSFAVRAVLVYFGYRAGPAGGVTVLLGGLLVNGVVANVVGLRAFVGRCGAVV